MNFYKHHIGDYDAHTHHLTWSQDLAYRRLLSAYYLRERPLPNDMPLIYRLAKATEASQKAAVRYVLEQFFVLAPSCCEGIPKVTSATGANPVSNTVSWHNARCDKEIEQYQAQCAANRRTTQERIVKRNGNESSTNRQPNQNQIPEPVDSNTTTSGFTAPQGEWWKSDKGIEATAKTLGVTAKPGGSYGDLKEQCFAAINAKKTGAKKAHRVA